MSVDVEELRKRLLWAAERLSTVMPSESAACTDAASSLESLRAENAELRKTLQGLQGVISESEVWRLKRELDALRWRPVSEPPEDTSGLFEFYDPGDPQDVHLFRWSGLAEAHGWTHYRRFVAPGEESKS